MQDSPDIDARKPLKAVTPYYPDIAKGNGREQWAMVWVTLDATGKVLKTQAMHANNSPVIGIQATLDSLGIAALRRWRFEPWRTSFKSGQTTATVKFLFKELRTPPEQEGRLFGRLINPDTGQYALSPNASLGAEDGYPYGLYDIHEDSFEFTDVSAGTYRLWIVGMEGGTVDTVVTITPGRADTVSYTAKRRPRGR
jgi:hypothetical protein